MVRQWMLTLMCTLLCLLAAPPQARAESAQEEAALKLFAQGKAAFKASQFESALPLFKSAHKVIDNTHTQYYLGRTYAAVGQCEAALPFLAQLAGQLPPQVEGERLADETRCMLTVARARVKREDCRGAYPLLVALAGRAQGEDATWREERAAYCSTRASDFPTDTPSRKAAYSLYEAALAAAAAGDGATAIPLLEKTLDLADEPIVRRQLAALQVAAGGCLPALQALEGIPTGARTAADKNLSAACGTYAPRAELSSANLERVVSMVTSGLTARREGRLSEALHYFDLASKAGKSPTVEAVAIDLLYEMDRCKQYAVRLAEASPAVQQAVTKRGKRLAACGVDAGGLAGAGAGGRPGPSGTTLSISGGTMSFSTSQLLEWSLVGVGATCLAASGLLAMQAQQDYDEGRKAMDQGNSGNAAQGAGGFSAASELEASGDEAVLNAQLLLGVGVGVIAAGVTLMFMGEDGDQSVALEDRGVEVTPWIGAGSFGLLGRF